MKTKIIVMIITAVSCLFIYKIAYKPKKAFVALGDGICSASSIGGASMTSFNDLTYKKLENQNKVNSYNKFLCQNKLNINKLIDNIKSNKQVDNTSVQNILDNAVVVTISVGFDEISSYKRFDRIKQKELLEKFNELIFLTRKYTKGKIIVLGMYSRISNNIDEFNRSLKQICLNNNAQYIDTSSISKKDTNFFYENSYKLSIKGHQEMFSMIMEKI